MLSPIIRIPSGQIDNVNDAVIGQAGGPTPAGASKFAGQLGMEFELLPYMIRLKNPAVPVPAGIFQYVRLAPAASSPAVGATVNWDATVLRSAYQVTTAAGTAAGTVLTANVTPGNYTVIQTKVSVPTGTIGLLAEEAAAAEADAIAKAKAEGKTDEEAAEAGRRAAKAVEEAEPKSERAARAKADAIAKAKAEGKTDEEAAEAGRKAAKAVEDKADVETRPDVGPGEPKPDTSLPETGRPGRPGRPPGAPTPTPRS
jgi:hypothetical protein